MGNLSVSDEVEQTVVADGGVEALMVLLRDPCKQVEASCCLLCFRLLLSHAATLFKASRIATNMRLSWAVAPMLRRADFT